MYIHRFGYLHWYSRKHSRIHHNGNEWWCNRNSCIDWKFVRLNVSEGVWLSKWVISRIHKTKMLRNRIDFWSDIIFLWIILDMNCKCSLQVSNQVWLIDQPKSSASIFYFGGTQSSTSTSIENIYLHMVSESQPEKHLHTLLTKGMLVEAEVIFICIPFMIYISSSNWNCALGFSK